MGLALLALFEYLFMEAIYTFDGYDVYGIDQAANGLIVLFLSFCGIFQLLVVDPHFKTFSIDGTVHKDWKPIILLSVLSIGAIVVYNIPFTCELMSIPQYPLWLQFSMVLLAVVWLVVQHMVLKWNKFTFMEDALERWYLKNLEKNFQKENEKIGSSESSK